MSLTDRVKVAKKIATSVSFVHTLGYVHKNIRPEVILGFSRTSGTGSHEVFLVSFENFRTVDSRTLKSGDSAWKKNLYGHPRRQGLNPNDICTMQHDI